MKLSTSNTNANIAIYATNRLVANAMVIDSNSLYTTLSSELAPISTYSSIAQIDGIAYTIRRNTLPATSNSLTICGVSVNKTYYVDYYISSYTGTATGIFSTSSLGTIATISGVGRGNFTFKSNTVDNLLIGGSASGANLNLDYVSVKEVVDKNTIIEYDNTTNSSSIIIQSVSPFVATNNNITTVNSTAINSQNSFFINGASPLLQSGFYGFSSGIVNAQFFTASGTWIKPTLGVSTSGYESVLIMMWGGGGGGYTAGTGSGAGGGGACLIATIPLWQLDATCAVTIGAGGARGVAGGSTTFAVNASSTMTAYGGGFGTGSISGGGGGLFGTGASGATGLGGGPLGGNSTVISSTFGGSYGGATVSYSIFGGAGGGGGSSATNLNKTIYGGGGGSGGSGVQATAPGTVFGGRGGNTSVSALAPGGGGNSLSGNTGARGEVRVWIIG